MTFDVDKHRKYIYAGTAVRKLSDIPITQHIAVLIFKQLWVDNGWGSDDPHEVFEYRIFKDEDELKGWIEVNYTADADKPKAIDFVIFNQAPIKPQFQLAVKI